MPVVDMFVDHDDSEIDLIIDPPDRETARSARPSTLSEFANRVQALPGGVPEITRSVPDAKSRERVGGYSFRIDVPIVGVFTNQEKHAFGFLQWFDGFEEEFGLDADE